MGDRDRRAARRRSAAAPLAVGEPADFLLVDPSGIEMTPGPLVEALVYASSSAAVDTVVVDGQVLMRHRRVDGEAEVRARALEAARSASGSRFPRHGRGRRSTTRARTARCAGGCIELDPAAQRTSSSTPSRRRHPSGVPETCSRT